MYMYIQQYRVRRSQSMGYMYFTLWGTCVRYTVLGTLTQQYGVRVSNSKGQTYPTVQGTRFLQHSSGYKHLTVWGTCIPKYEL